MLTRLLLSSATTLLLLLTTAGCGSDEVPRATTTDATKTAATKTPPAPRAAVEVKDAVLVRNSARTATLSATIVNNSEQAYRLADIYVDDVERSDEFEPMSPASTIGGHPLKPGGTSHLGHADDPFRLRIIGTKDLATAVPLTMRFDTGGDPFGTSVTIDVPVVERTADHADIVDDGPIPEIQVVEGKIVVVPGQRQAYVTGYLESSIDDIAMRLPTAAHADGRPVTWQFTTATGGPYGNFAEKGKKVLFGIASPFLASTDGSHGDSDHVLASDVTVGEIITVRFRFSAGDVVGELEVVQGRADGTL